MSELFNIDNIRQMPLDALVFNAWTVIPVLQDRLSAVEAENERLRNDVGGSATPADLPLEGEKP